MQGHVIKEVDLQADDDDLSEIRGDAHVVAPGAELGQGFVSGASEFEAGRDDRCVEVENRAQLDFYADLHTCSGEGFALENPSAAVAEDRREVGEQVLPLFVGEALDVERFHDVRVPLRLEVICAGVFIGGKAPVRDSRGTGVT